MSVEILSDRSKRKANTLQLVLFALDNENYNALRKLIYKIIQEATAGGFLTKPLLAIAEYLEKDNVHTDLVLEIYKSAKQIATPAGKDWRQAHEGITRNNAKISPMTHQENTRTAWTKTKEIICDPPPRRRRTNNKIKPADVARFFEGIKSLEKDKAKLSAWYFIRAYEHKFNMPSCLSSVETGAVIHMTSVVTPKL